MRAKATECARGTRPDRYVDTSFRCEVIGQRVSPMSKGLPYVALTSRTRDTSCHTRDTSCDTRDTSCHRCQGVMHNK